MCRLIFETVKWENGAPCLLPWHQRRMEAAIGVHGSDGASVPDLASVLSDCPGPEGRGVYKATASWYSSSIRLMTVIPPPLLYTIPRSSSSMKRMETAESKSRPLKKPKIPV